jgi:hypothetical protein
MAWTTPRTWTDGELVTKAIMDPHIRDNFNAVSWHLLAAKSADETVVSSTTLQNDDHLFFSIGSSETWMLKCGLWIDDTSDGAADYKIAFTFPSATMTMTVVSLETTPTSYKWETSGTAVLIGFNGTTATFMEISGMITTSASGTVQLQWAQTNSSASGLIFKKGSYLVGSKLF